MDAHFTLNRIVATIDGTIPSHFYQGTLVGEPRPNLKYVKRGQWFSIEDARRLQLAFEHNRVLDLLVRELMNEEI